MPCLDWSVYVLESSFSVGEECQTLGVFGPFEMLGVVKCIFRETKSSNFLACANMHAYIFTDFAPMTSYMLYAGPFSCVICVGSHKIPVY